MDTKIPRHIKIRSIANPYLPEYRKYFEEREKWAKKCAIIQWIRDKNTNVILDT